MGWLELVLSCGFLALASAGKLTSRTNPGCDQVKNASICNTQHLVSTVFNRNSTHDFVYLWSDIGVPAVTVARTSKPQSLNIQWNKEAQAVEEELLESVHLEADYVQTSLFTRMMAINTSSFSLGQQPYFQCNLSAQSWWLGEQTSQNNNANVPDVTVNFTMLAEGQSPECKFSILFETSDSEGRGQLLPRLKYTDNSTRVEMEFRDFVTTSPSGEDLALTMGLTYVLEILIIPYKGSALDLSSSKTLDDEYTPSQFWHSQIVNGPKQGFHYWKPIVYTNDTKRNINNSAHIDLFEINKEATLLTLNQSGIDVIPYSLATVLNDGNISMDDVRVLYLTFNATQTPVQIFDMVVGYGDVPKDSISLTVILIIALGLGLPSIVLLFGVPSVTIYKRCKRQESGYAPIQ